MHSHDCTLTHIKNIHDFTHIIILYLIFFRLLTSPNMSMIISVLLVVAATTLLATNVRAQNNGDIRLVNNVKDNYDGRLEVFMDGKWGTICGKSGTDIQAVADTACRQLGFKEAFVYGTVTDMGYPIAPDSTPIHIGSIDCPSTFWDGTCSTGYNQHVLRCAVDTKVDTTVCTHSNDIGVYCLGEAITLDPYESQVAIHVIGNQQHFANTSLSSGGLIMFFDKSSKPGVVCGKGFDKDAADTACRQLGYTNAKNFNTSPLNHTTKWTFWDVGLECKSQSHSCFNNCFSKTPNNHTTCRNLVSLSCEFDLSRKDTESPGSPRLCDATLDNSCKPQVEEHIAIVPIIVFVIVILAIIAACTTCITLLVCCFVPGCLIHRKRTGYQPVN